MSAPESDSAEEMRDAESNPTSPNGESALKIPKLMDIAANLPPPKLMRQYPSASMNASSSAFESTVGVSPSISGATSASSSTKFDPSVSLEHIRAAQHKFIDDRDWHRYHTPRNLLLAMVGEVGELAELFQWRGEVGVLLPDWQEDDKRNLRHELADVFLYLTRLSEQCGVDLPRAVMEKIALNEKKYPVEMVRGSSKKYYEYKKGTKLAPPQEVEDSTENGAECAKCGNGGSGADS